MSVGSKSSSNLSIERYLVAPLDEEPASAAAIKAALAQEAGVQPHSHCENALNKLPQVPDDSCSSMLVGNSRLLSDDGLISKRCVSVISPRHSSASRGSASLAELVVGAGNAAIMPRMQLLPKGLKGSTSKRMRKIKGAMSLSFALFAKKLLRQSMSGSVRGGCAHAIENMDMLLLGGTNDYELENVLIPFYSKSPHLCRYCRKRFPDFATTQRLRSRCKLKLFSCSFLPNPESNFGFGMMSKEKYCHLCDFDIECLHENASHLTQQYADTHKYQ